MAATNEQRHEATSTQQHRRNSRPNEWSGFPRAGHRPNGEQTEERRESETGQHGSPGLCVPWAMSSQLSSLWRQANQSAPQRKPLLPRPMSRPLSLCSRRRGGTGGLPTPPQAYLAQQRRITRLGYPFRIVQVHDPACSGTATVAVAVAAAAATAATASATPGLAAGPWYSRSSLGPRHRRPAAPQPRWPKREQSDRDAGGRVAHGRRGNHTLAA